MGGRKRGWRLLLVWLLGAAFLLPACRDGEAQIGPLRIGRGGSGAPAPTAAEGWHEVPLRVVEGGGGGVLAFVPVTIQEQGPFAFALDTGASHSLIDRRAAERLGLSPIGKPSEVTGVSGATDARLVRIERWRIGDVALPGALVVMLELPHPAEQDVFHGLFGSDMLSHFGAILIDYDRRTLRLRPR